MSRTKLGCAVFLGIAVVAVVAVPFTRELLLGVLRGEPIDGDLRPLSYHVEQLNDPDPIVVAHALGSIGVMKSKGIRAIPDILNVARDPKRGPMRASESFSLRTLALRVIQDMGPSASSAVPGVIEFLTHPDQMTRMAAAEALVGIGPAALEDPRPIVAALHDEWGAVRRPIARLLNTYEPGALKDEIQTMLTDKDASDEQRRDACEWAGRFGPQAKDLLPALKKARDAPSAMVSLAAEEAITRIEPPAQREDR
jgi:HEAT repeat protein